VIIVTNVWNLENLLQEEYQQELREARKQQEEQAEYAKKLKRVGFVFTSTLLQSFASFLCKLFFYLVPI